MPQFYYCTAEAVLSTTVTRSFSAVVLCDFSDRHIHRHETQRSVQVKSMQVNEVDPADTRACIAQSDHHHDICVGLQLRRVSIFVAGPRGTTAPRPLMQGIWGATYVHT